MTGVHFLIPLITTARYTLYRHFPVVSAFFKLITAMKKTLLLGTRKGLMAYRFENGNWQAENLSFEGVPVSIAYADPRNGRWWAALDHGHWGVKLHRSN